MVTLEILANQISVALSGEALEMLNKLPESVQIYVMKMAWKYYCRRYNIEQNFNNSEFRPMSNPPVPNPLLERYKTSQDLGNNDRLPGLERDFDSIDLASNIETPVVSEGSQTARNVFDWNWDQSNQSATTQLYGTSISYNKELPQNYNLNGPTPMPYPITYAGQPQQFNFSGEDFTSGEGADPAEY